jgi:hypothetical protein
MFSPVRFVEDLPAVGVSNERRSLDFKAAPTKDRYEIAKDVAAFANAEGGSILVGAKGSGEFLAAYEPLSIRDASNVQRTYDESIRDRCSPLPLFDIAAVPQGTGCIVAVNVWPFPGQPVGVKFKKTDVNCGALGRQPEGLFFYPLRVGAHTSSISPEQMPMFLDARTRRTAICLEQAVGQTVILSAITHQSNGKRGEMWVETGRLTKVDLLGNAVTVAMTCEKEEVLVALPLDFIVSAWRQEQEWRLLIKGRVQRVHWSKDCGKSALVRHRLFFDADA